MTSFRHQFWRFCAFFWLCGLVAGCVDTSKVSRVALLPETGITFLLIDNSLSYNNPTDNTSQRVMQMVKREIVTKLKQAQPGEHLIVRTIHPGDCGAFWITSGTDSTFGMWLRVGNSACHQPRGKVGKARVSHST